MFRVFNLFQFIIVELYHAPVCELVIIETALNFLFQSSQNPLNINCYFLYSRQDMKI
jgi:hypothetical protein